MTSSVQCSQYILCCVRASSIGTIVVGNLGCEAKGHGTRNTVLFNYMRGRNKRTDREEIDSLIRVNRLIIIEDGIVVAKRMIQRKGYIFLLRFIFLICHG